MERLGSDDYDMIFLDHMMPGFDGVETLRRIREINNGMYKELLLLLLPLGRFLSYKLFLLFPLRFFVLLSLLLLYLLFPLWLALYRLSMYNAFLYRRLLHGLRSLHRGMFLQPGFLSCSLRLLWKPV